MATLQLTDSTLAVSLTRAEKIAGLLRDVEVPLASVRSVEVVADPLAAVRGLRAPGLALAEPSPEWRESSVLRGLKRLRVAF